MRTTSLLIILGLSFSCANTKSVEENHQENPDERDRVPVVNLADGLDNVSDVRKSLNQLFLFNDDEGCGYVNLRGDTIIAPGTYQKCFTDTIIHFGAFLTHSNKFVGVNTKSEVLFEIYPFDNGPDYFSEGMIRIKLGDKIGYANEKGKVVIAPKYACAFPFENGRAKVALECTITKHGEHSHVNSNQWVYIDKKGNVVGE